jgi:predicted metal-dependent phosphoesterase TrpH
MEKEQVMGLADLHIHSIHSYDGTASVPAILRRAKELGLNVIAITDHDEIAGALKAMELASTYGIQVIPGIEITTADGDLLAYNITEKVPPHLPVEETILRVGALGGFCIAAHPMASGMGMNSLSALSILKIVRNPKLARFFIGIETYNATAIDRLSNQSARLMAKGLPVAKVGNSDAHILSAIGLGATEFTGSSAADLINAIKNRKTRIRKQKEWTAFRILGLWAVNYVGSTFTRLGWVSQ